MESVIVLLLIVLIAAVAVVALKVLRPAVAPAPVALDTNAIVASVQTAIDVNAIAASVKGAVEAQMLQTATQALANNNQQAEQQANQTLSAQKEALDQQTRLLLKPFEERMKQLAESVGQLQSTYLKEQGTIGQLASQLAGLQDTTTSLKRALKSPTAAGSWGENQLRNVIRLAGMENYCDFTEQFTGGEGDRIQRPDVVINLAGGALLAVDSKAPLAAYMRMQESDDVGVKEAELKQHAKDLRLHVKALADKRYWDQFGHASPDFVIMFIPGEGFVSDAMRSDTTLMEDAMRMNVLISSPVNLLSLLLTVSKSWQSHKLAEHAEKVAELGVELHDRVGVVVDAINKMGTNLGTATTAYNSMVGSFESRLLVTLRKFKDLGVVKEDVKDMKSLENTPRGINAVEAGQLPPASAGELSA
jgi:DNA recombination protein RmuC